MTLGEHNNFEAYEQSLLIAKEKGIRIVCTMSNVYHRWKKFPEFKFYTAVGPEEFINLVKFSKAVVCGSFHAVVFSLIYSKPFYAYKGMSDSRISNLLKMTGLERCADYLYDNSTYDFIQIHSLLNSYIDSSRSFLIENLK